MRSHDSPASYNPLQSRLIRGEVLILDGAMGTELDRRGVKTPLPLWSAQALLDAPEVVRAIHGEYLPDDGTHDAPCPPEGGRCHPAHATRG